MSWCIHDSEYLEKRGVPTSTVVTTAFLQHSRLAAKHLHIGDLPLLVTPHPLNDLTPEDVRELARVAYPVVIQQLTGQGPLKQDDLIDFVRPAKRDPQGRTGASDTHVPYSGKT